MDAKNQYMLVSIQKLQNKEAQVNSNTRTKRSPTKEKKNTKHTRWKKPEENKGRQDKC